MSAHLSDDLVQQQPVLPAVFPDDRLKFGKISSQNSFDDSDHSTELVEVEIESPPRTDLPGLLSYLDGLQRDSIRFQEATYVGNKWTWNGMLPFKHYGFIILLSNGEYLSLDFGRRGIVWDVYDDFPDYPDGTFLVERYIISNSKDLELTRLYCQETKPFIWLIHDCHTWSQGLIQHLRMERINESMKRSRQVKDSTQQHRPKRIYGYVSCM